MAKNSDVRRRSNIDGVFGGVVFQDLHISASLRLFCKGGFGQIRYKIIGIKNDCRLDLPYVKRYNDIRIFGEIKGIGWGTLVMALLNGAIIGFFSKLLDRTFDFQPTFRKLAVAFDLNGATLLKNEKEEEKENV